MQPNVCRDEFTPYKQKQQRHHETLTHSGLLQWLGWPRKLPQELPTTTHIQHETLAHSGLLVPGVAQKTSTRVPHHCPPSAWNHRSHGTLSAWGGPGSFHKNFPITTHCSPLFSIRGDACSVTSLPKDHDQVSLGWPLLCFPWGVHLHATSCSEFVSVFSMCPSRLPVSVVDIFQTGVTSIRWQKWFTETGQISHSNWSDTRLSTLLPELHAYSLKQIHIHTQAHIHTCARMPHALSLCFLFVFRTSQTK